MSSIIAHLSFRHRGRRRSGAHGRSDLYSELDSMWGDASITHPLGPAFLGLYKSLPPDAHVLKDSLLDLSCYITAATHLPQPLQTPPTTRTTIGRSNGSTSLVPTVSVPPSLNGKGNLLRARSEPDIRPSLARPYSTSAKLGSTTTIDVYPLSQEDYMDDSPVLGAYHSPLKSSDIPETTKSASSEATPKAKPAHQPIISRHPRYKVSTINDRLYSEKEAGGTNETAVTKIARKGSGRDRLRPKVPLAIFSPGHRNLENQTRNNGPLSSSFLAGQKSPARSIKSVRFDIPSPSQGSFSINERGSVEEQRSPEDVDCTSDEPKNVSLVGEVQASDMDQPNPSPETRAPSRDEDTVLAQTPSMIHSTTFETKTKHPGLAVTEMMRSQSPAADVAGSKHSSLPRSGLGLNRAIYGPLDGGPRSAKSIASTGSIYFTPVSARFPDDVTERIEMTSNIIEVSSASTVHGNAAILDFQARSSTAYYERLQRSLYERDREAHLSSLMTPVEFF